MELALPSKRNQMVFRMGRTPRHPIQLWVWFALHFDNDKQPVNVRCAEVERTFTKCIATSQFDPTATFRGGNVRADATLCEVLRTYPKYLRQTRHY